MVSSISGGMGAAVGATSSAVNATAGVVSSMLSLAGSATSMGANAGATTMSWLAATQPPQDPVLALPSTAEPSSGYDSDGSQSTYSSVINETTDNQLGQPTAAASLGGDTYTLSATNQSTGLSGQSAALSLGPPTAPPSDRVTIIDKF